MKRGERRKMALNDDKQIINRKKQLDKTTHIKENICFLIALHTQFREFFPFQILFSMDSLVLNLSLSIYVY